MSGSLDHLKHVSLSSVPIQIQMQGLSGGTIEVRRPHLPQHHNPGVRVNLTLELVNLLFLRNCNIRMCKPLLSSGYTLQDILRSRYSTLSRFAAATMIVVPPTFLIWKTSLLPRRSVALYGFLPGTEQRDTDCTTRHPSYKGHTSRRLCSPSI